MFCHILLPSAYDFSFFFFCWCFCIARIWPPPYHRPNRAQNPPSLFDFGVSAFGSCLPLFVRAPRLSCNITPPSLRFFLHLSCCSPFVFLLFFSLFRQGVRPHDAGSPMSRLNLCSLPWYPAFFQGRVRFFPP